MAWRDNLRPASFRGVQFFVDTSSFTSGRKISIHEFPDRDIPFVEDLGKVSRSFNVDGHILGDDYFEIKQELIRATERRGPGELIHPYYGTLQVQLGAFSISEDTRVGRIASVSFQFYESGDNRFPENTEDKLSVVDDRSDALVEASKSEFDDNFSIDGLPGYAVETSSDKVKSLSNLFDDSTKGIVTISEEVSKLAFNNRNLVAEVDDLLASPGDLTSRLLDSFSLLDSSIPSSSDKSAAIAIFSNFGAGDVASVFDTPIRKTEQENSRLMNSFIKQVSIANAAKYASDTEFASVDEANQEREKISDLIQEELESTTSDDVFQALQDLNAILIRTIPDIDNELPNIENVEVKNTTNSLVLVYDLYENPDSEQDMIDRNNIEKPGLIQTGETLEVIDVRRS